ncbi:MAG: hypothetical protein QM568_11430 [Microbacterium sp.]
MERFVPCRALGVGAGVGVGDLGAESAEEGLDEFAPRCLRERGIERAGVADEGDGCLGAFGTVAEGVFGAREAFLDGSLLQRELLQTFSELWHGEVSVGEGVDEASFLLAELGELFGEAVSRGAFGGLQVRDDGFDSFLDLVEDLGSDAFIGDSLRYGLFELFDTDAWHGALAFELGCADVVLVGAAVAGVLAVDEAAISSCVVAVCAVDEPFEVVEVDAVAVATAVAASEDLFDAEVELLRDEGLMAAGVELAFVADDAGVVRIAEDDAERIDGDRLRAILPRCSCDESLFFEGRCELGDGVLTCGVLFEGPDDQRCPDGVDVDSVDQGDVPLSGGVSQHRAGQLFLV